MHRGQKMELTLVIGLVLGLLSVIVGLILKGVSLAILLNGEAATIIFVGIIATVLNSFSSTEVKRIPKILSVLFRKPNLNTPDVIAEVIELSTKARRNGLLSLENVLTNENHPFLVQGLKMVIDGVPTDQVRIILENQITALEDRHHRGAKIFKVAGSTSPTLGVLGAVIGLIGALGHLNNITVLGHSISAAFVATLYGIFTGYVVLVPFSERLNNLSEIEIKQLEVITEGILAIQAGLPATTIEKKLYAMIDDAYVEE